MEKKKRILHREDPNEGEGNKTAARRFNKEQRRFVESHDVAGKAHEAERAREGAERRQLEHAEVVGRRHAADEDPEITRSYEKSKR